MRKENTALRYLVELLSQPMLLLLHEEEIMRDDWLRH
jgi:hypothetical protein